MKLKSTWFLPLTLADPYFISFKAGLAVSLASAFSLYLANNPDLTSACFVAVVSISPTPLLGFKTSVGQLVSSAIGSGWGLLMRAIGIPEVYGTGLSVLLSIFSSFIARQSNFYISAAFSAFFVQVVPYGGIANTLKIRALALSVGCTCALVVNILIALFFTEKILSRRTQIATGMVICVTSIIGNNENDESNEYIENNSKRKEKNGEISTNSEMYIHKLDEVASNSQPVFGVLNTLLGELNSVAIEANILHKKFSWLEKYAYKIKKLKHFLHLVVQFGNEIQRVIEEENSKETINHLCASSQEFIGFLCNSLQEKVTPHEMPLEETFWEQKYLKFPSDYIQRVARDLVRLVEDIKHGPSAITVNTRNGSITIPSENTDSENSAYNITSDIAVAAPNQFYRTVGHAQSSMNANANEK